MAGCRRRARDRDRASTSLPLGQNHRRGRRDRGDTLSAFSALSAVIPAPAECALRVGLIAVPVPAALRRLVRRWRRRLACVRTRWGERRITAAVTGSGSGPRPRRPKGTGGTPVPPPIRNALGDESDLQRHSVTGRGGRSPGFGRRAAGGGIRGRARGASCGGLTADPATEPCPCP